MMNQYISALSLKELLTVNCEVEKIFQKNWHLEKFLI
jgi:hypothetical protein